MSREHLIFLLAAAIKTDPASIKDSLLLKAYATFKSMENETKLEYAYQNTIDKYIVEYPYGLLKNASIDSSAKWADAYNAFNKLSPEEFLRFIVPDLVCDPKAFMESFQMQYSRQDVPILAHLIIQINRAIYEAIDSSARTVKMSDDSISLVRKVYECYLRIEKNESLRFDKDSFQRIYFPLALHILETNMLIPKAPGYKAKDLFNIVDILSNQLQLPRDEQLKLLLYIYNKGNKPIRPDEVSDFLPVYRYMREQDVTERRKILSAVIKLIIRIPPMDLLCILTVTKKNGRPSIKTSSEYAFCHNDVSLETGLIYQHFSSLIDVESEDKVAIFFPSPYFVRKWLQDSDLQNVHVTFVFEATVVCDLIRLHYSDGCYSATIAEKVTFVTYEEWEHSVLKVPVDGTFQRALAFFTSSSFNVVNQIDWYKLINEYFVERADLCTVVASNEFENSRLPFLSEFELPQMHLQSILLVPQGINNSTHPRRKLIIDSHFLPHSDAKICSSSYTVRCFSLTSISGSQALSEVKGQQASFSQNDLENLESSVRLLYRQEILARRASDKTKGEAFSYNFTPEIVVWCNKVYPKNNSSRPRLEAYIRYPSLDYLLMGDCNQKGKIIMETRKHSVKIADADILQWLEQYPFSKIQQRTSMKERLSDISGSRAIKKEEIDIRETVVENYLPMLQGHNVTLKTLWYLYPNFEDLFSPADYSLLSEIVCSDMGMIRIQNIQSQSCEELLLECYPSEMQSQLKRRFKILSLLVDEAVRNKFCTDNPLHKTLENSRNSDKLFSQVRNALVKKHLTKDEMIKAFRVIRDELTKERTECFGVLLRLLTGLSCNVICGLKFKDIRFISDFRFYSLVIIWQVTNDGKSYCGFTSLEDYLCFPCTKMLMEYLFEQKMLIQKLAPNDIDIDDLPLVNTSKAYRHTRKASHNAYPPKDLETISKEILASLGIDDRIIEVPTVNNGRKETNLNRYGGDFFRENFRFWAHERAACTNDEILYLIGNKPETTFGIYYCDFLNDVSQFNMKTKLQRIDAMLTDEVDAPFERQIKKGRNTFIMRNQNPMHLYIKINPVKGQGRLHIHIHAEHSPLVFLSPVNKKEE